MHTHKKAFIFWVFVILAGFAIYELIIDKTSVQTTTNIPAAVPIVKEIVSSVFIDESKTVSFTHPTALDATEGEKGYTTLWRNNTETRGISLAKLIVPKSVQPSTNFSTATFTVGASTDPVAIKDCLIATNGEIANGDASFKSIKYKKFILGDAGAGNRYDTTSYRTIRNGRCYAVEYVIHSTAIGNYAPDQGIKEFDRTSITATLEAIAQSVTFI